MTSSGRNTWGPRWLVALVLALALISTEIVAYVLTERASLSASSQGAALWGPVFLLSCWAYGRLRHIWPGAVDPAVLPRLAWFIPLPVLLSGLVGGVRLPALEVLAALLLGAAAEEVIFRGVVPAVLLLGLRRTALPRWASVALAVAISSLVFVTLHLDPNPLASLDRLLFAVVVSYVCWRTSRLREAIGIHVASNLFWLIWGPQLGFGVAIAFDGLLMLGLSAIVILQARGRPVPSGLPSTNGPNAAVAGRITRGGTIRPATRR